MRFIKLILSDKIFKKYEKDKERFARTIGEKVSWERYFGYLQVKQC
jgi:hypothetical protein